MKLMILMLAACASLACSPLGRTSDETIIEPEPADQLRDRMNSQQQVAAAVSMLAKQLAISTDDINIVSHRSVTWPSGAIGCPAMGHMYTQALVPGALIILTANEQSYRFHAVVGGEPFHCQNDRAQPPTNLKQPILK